MRNHDYEMGKSSPPIIRLNYESIQSIKKLEQERNSRFYNPDTRKTSQSKPNLFSLDSHKNLNNISTDSNRQLKLNYQREYRSKNKDAEKNFIQQQFANVLDELKEELDEQEKLKIDIHQPNFFMKQTKVHVINLSQSQEDSPQKSVNQKDKSSIMKIKVEEKLPEQQQTIVKRQINSKSSENLSKVNWNRKLHQEKDFERMLTDIDIEDDDLKGIVNELDRHFQINKLASKNRTIKIESINIDRETQIKLLKGSTVVQSPPKLTIETPKKNHSPVKVSLNMHRLQKAQNKVILASKITSKDINHPPPPIIDTLSNKKKMLTQKLSQAIKVKVKMATSQNSSSGGIGASSTGKMSLYDKLRFSEFKNEKDYCRFLDIMIKPTLIIQKQQTNPSTTDNFIFQSKAYYSQKKQEQLDHSIIWDEKQLKLMKDQLQVVSLDPKTTPPGINKQNSGSSNSDDQRLNLNKILTIQLSNIEKIESIHLSNALSQRTNYASNKNIKQKKYTFKILLKTPLNKNEFNDSQLSIPSLNKHLQQNFFCQLTQTRNKQQQSIGKREFQTSSRLSKASFNGSIDIEGIQAVDSSDFCTNTVILNNEEDLKSVLSSEMNSINLNKEDIMMMDIDTQSIQQKMQERISINRNLFNMESINSFRCSINSQQQQEQQLQQQQKQQNPEDNYVELGCDDEILCKKWVVLIKWMLNNNAQ
ncbi:UNKNOWN [Stylonychia lemnae]|uniref:Uncharacterized protein n=1 Tax=Stylonychia lemnae TaxID=5949 RepID=A0A078AT33_STYLE|nr:UNKNOWN [Stylonychia lemnae]|eukprot:CDW85615.1 UNKNOWN [Stylonychia lemnae]